MYLFMNIKQKIFSIFALIILVCSCFAECDFSELEREAMRQYRNPESMQKMLYALVQARDCFESKGLHLIYWDQLPVDYGNASFVLYMRILNVALHAENYDLARDALGQLLGSYQFSVNGLEIKESALLVVHGWRLMENSSESPRWESGRVDSLLLDFIESLEE